MTEKNENDNGAAPEPVEPTEPSTPAPPVVDVQGIIDTTGEMVDDVPDPEDELNSLDAVIGDVKIQKNRLKRLADRLEMGEINLDTLSVLRELHGNLLPLMNDTLLYVQRLWEHAGWAGERIVDLTGESDTASQLVTEDAERYKKFLASVISDLDARIAIAADPEAKGAKELALLRDEATELMAITEDLELHEEEDDDAPEDVAEAGAQA